MHRTDGDTAEIEFLYRQHGPALLLFAQGVTGERSRAQDAVHQVFLKLIEKGSLDRVADKKAYLFACVRNAALNEGKLRERNAPLEHSGKDLLQEDPFPAAEESLELEDRRARAPLDSVMYNESVR